MKYIVIFKRFEVWLLIGVVVALLVFAFRPSESFSVASNDSAVEAVPGEMELENPPTQDSAFAVEEVEVRPTGEGRIVELTLLTRSLGETEVPIDETTLEVRSDSGAEVPPFFEPFRAHPVALPGEPSLVAVKFWLEEEAESLELQFQGETALAKLSED